MRVHGCRQPLRELADSVLRDHLAALRHEMEPERAMWAAAFWGYPSAGKNLRKLLSRRIDPRGCYVFMRGRKPIYVGISKHVIKRICEHINGTTHNSATLAYKMAAAAVKPKVSGKKPTRGAAMTKGEFMRVFKEKRCRLLDMRVAFIPIDNPLELYLFEAYAAMELRTGRWNTFATH